MRYFEPWDMEAADAWTAQGGQAVQAIQGWSGKAGAVMVLDRDGVRLMRTARELDLSPIIIRMRGTERQHIVVGGGPMRRVMRKCEEDARDQAGPIAEQIRRFSMEDDIDDE